MAILFSVTYPSHIYECKAGYDIRFVYSTNNWQSLYFGVVWEVFNRKALLAGSITFLSLLDTTRVTRPNKKF